MSEQPFSISDRSCTALIETLAQALDARDPYTAGHSQRVAAYAYGIAVELNLPREQAEVIRAGAQLHDIGKIGIPDAVLLKPGPLTAEEFGLIKLHPQIGRRILEKALGFESLLEIVEMHHENFDGSGYPYGLAGEKIPLEARIVRIADAYDAMTTRRSYRSAFAPDVAMEAIRVGSGREFDPIAVEAFLNVNTTEGSLVEFPSLNSPTPSHTPHPEAVLISPSHS